MDDRGSREFDLASDQINEVNRLYWRNGFAQDAFCIEQFRLECGTRHVARHPAAFDQSVIEGEKAPVAGDIAALRSSFADIWLGQVSIGDAAIANRNDRG